LDKQPLITLCIPTYNRASYLAETLRSILPQAGSDVEIAISDNASTDRTETVVAEFQKDYPVIAYSRNESNMGFDRNLLRVTELAKGKYVWLFGSDDLLKDGAVEAVRNKILSSSVKPALVYLNHEVFTPERGVLIPYKIRRKADRDLDALECLKLLGSNLGYMSALVLRRDPLQKLEIRPGIVDLGWIHLYLVLGCLRAGGVIRYVGRPYVSARLSPNTDYNHAKVFVDYLDRVLWDARNWGYSPKIVTSLVNYLIRDQHFPYFISSRCNHPEVLSKAFPRYLRAYWKFPRFWFLLFPARYVPRILLLAAQWWARKTRRRIDLSRSNMSGSGPSTS
jgi:glycosyltransferase involved in cell wall biosynthesis